MRDYTKVLIIASLHLVSSEVYIKTKLGTIQGTSMLSRNGKKFNAFLGIPYAKPPLGNLRFQNPQLNDKPWKGILDGSKYPPVCPQLNGSDMFIGQENCLHVNIYAPETESNEQLPVWVFIYGGRRLSGNASPNKHGPHYIMDKPVVFVTLTYRINILGFLSTEDNVIPGNYGLKDEVIALKWIKNHIESFKGDQTNVTISGGSTGGIDVSLHLCSPSSKGLFHRAISQSGHPLQTIMSPGSIRRQTWILARHLGCEKEKRSEELLKCLQNLPVEKLVRSLLWKPRDTLTLRFGVVIETKDTEDRFLANYPQHELKKSHSEPWLLGVNQDEGSIGIVAQYSEPKNVNFLIKNLKHALPLFLKYHELPNKDEVTNLILKNYFKKPIDQWFSELSKIFGTIYFFTGAINSAKYYKGEKYFYVYDHENEVNYGRNYYLRGLHSKERIGVSHGEELRSLQHYPSLFPPIIEGNDRIVSDQVISLWYNFVKFGNPNGDDENIWQPVTGPDLEYLYIHDLKLEMKSRPFSPDYLLFKNLTERIFSEMYEKNVSVI